MPGEGLDVVNRYCCEELEKLRQITPEEKAAILKATAEDIRCVG
jgi:hypothetical protein